jgi:hypothetical protein
MATRKLIELDDAHGRSTATAEFLLHLHRSSELLRSDRTEDARHAIEQAFDAQPEDPSGQATLALVYFKLGLYPHALAIYRRLVAAHPGDPVLRLNLALACFKTGQADEAKSELERAVAIAPDYRKAHGYLGLAYQRLGDFTRAREAVGRAGANHLAERMARFIEPDRDALAEPPDAIPVPPIADPPEPPIEPPVAPEDAGPAPTAPATETGLPLLTPVDLARAEGLSEPVPLAELTTNTRLDEPLSGRFLVSDSGYLLVNVADRVFSRLGGLHFSSNEGLSRSPLSRHKRGGPSTEGFGGSDDPVFDIEGAGRLGFHPGDGVFSAVRLSGEISYVREELVFAFDPELDFDHGSLPSGDSPLVHFRGHGSIVFRSPVPPHSLEVTPDRGVVIPADGLIGWFGRLLPRRAEGGPFDPGLDALEFVGEGILLFYLV